MRRASRPSPGSSRATTPCLTERGASARALVRDPAFVFADEPTGNLDDLTGGSIVDLLFGIRRERGTTLVLVTHDASLASRRDRTVRLRAGRIAADAAPAGSP